MREEDAKKARNVSVAKDKIEVWCHCGMRASFGVVPFELGLGH